MQKTVLIADDLATNRRILRGILEKEYDILEAANGEEALDILIRNRDSISAVLLDIIMPKVDGYEALKSIRANASISHMPVIMITGSEDEESRLKSLTLGANDYVMKPYSSEIIKHCLRNNIALREAAAAVNMLQRDTLTGLWNRETFFLKAAEEIETRPEGYFLIGCTDIDGFKVINDQYGSETGDRILICLADQMKRMCDTRGGICGRIFADRFVSLYPLHLLLSSGIGPKALEDRILEEIGINVTLSVGRYIVSDKSLSVNAMLDRATIAKNTVKGRFDARVAMYDESMRSHILREQQIVTDMNAALVNKQFEIWYQPQYNHSTDAMIGAEALVRWRHPKNGLIPPNEFIPIFERNGFIYSLDQFVWEEVCRNLRKWRDEGRSPLPISVNISRYDALQPDLAEVITGLVEKYGLPRDLLRLEITESAFTQATRRIVEVITDLIAKGFTLEIDDFGSGYSSLNTLKDVPAQVVKLDMKFLESYGDSQRGGNIVESVVRMAKWLGMSVIAEGVETVEQADYLRSIGCSYMQGYLFARPMPREAYEAHCRDGQKEERLLTLETVENLDNNSFWDPNSMDTLIFNTYVGGACIFEYHNGDIELLRATEKYAQVIGNADLSVEQVLKLNLANHLDGESRKRVDADLQESVRTRKEVTNEYVFLDLPGCPRETYIRVGMRVIASAGERYLVYCTNENITAQRQSEKREQSVADQLNAVMENLNAGVTATVMEGDKIRIIFANSAHYEQLGFTKAEYEAQYRGIPNSIHPEDRERVIECNRTASLTGKPASVEFRVVRTDGETLWIRSNITVMRYPGVESPVQLAVATDVTQRRKAEQAIAEASAQIQSMMNDMPGGFVRVKVGRDGIVRPVYFNKGFEKLTAMSEAEVMDLYGDNALAGIHPDDVPEVELIIAGLIRSGAQHMSRYRLRHGNGGYIWLSTVERASVDKEGDSFINIYYTDASEQIKEEEIQKTLLDNLPSGAGVYELKDGQMSLTYQNKSYWELVGLNEAGFLDSEPMSAIHPNDIPAVMQELSAAISENRDVVCDIRLRHLKRGYRPVRLAGRVVEKEPGDFLIYATFTPNEPKSGVSQQTMPAVLSAIMESTSDLAFAKDTSFRYLTCSRAFAKMVGKAGESEIIGKTDYDLFDREMADTYRRDDEELLKTGKQLIDRIESIPSPNGAPRYSKTAKYLLRDSGVVIGLYGIGRDITETTVSG